MATWNLPPPSTFHTQGPPPPAAGLLPNEPEAQLTDFQRSLLQQSRQERETHDRLHSKEAETKKKKKPEWKVYNFVTQNIFGVMLSVFLLVFLCLLLLQPSFVCRRSKSMYAGNKLDWARVFTVSASVSLLVLIIGFVTGST